MRQKTTEMELPLEDRGEAPNVERSGEAGRAARGGARSGVGHECLMELVVGCENCRGGGFRGRIGIFEIFQVDDEVRHLINQDLSTPQLRRRARELGMRTLREDGIRKVLVGMTSASEVIGVTMSDSE